MELTIHNRSIGMNAIIYKMDTYRCRKHLYSDGILL